MGKKIKIPRILFFTNGHATEEDRAEAEELGPGVVFRRGDLVRDDGALEAFDAVAGAVPDRYAAKAAEQEREREENPPQDTPKAEGTPIVNGAPVTPPQPKPGAASAWKPNA